MNPSDLEDRIDTAHRNAVRLNKAVAIREAVLDDGIDPIRLTAMLTASLASSYVEEHIDSPHASLYAIEAFDIVEQETAKLLQSAFDLDAGASGESEQEDDE